MGKKYPKGPLLFDPETIELGLGGALCAEPGRDPDLWFADPSEEPVRVQEAITVCEGCPVKQECAEFAVRHGEIWGVWGGVSRG